MLRRIIAGTAVAGALTLGVAGVAGAATPSSGTGTSGTPSATACARVSKVQNLEAKLNAWLPKAQAREAKATAAGHTKLANRIGTRITKVQNRETKLNARISKLEAKCGTTGSTGTSTPS